MFKVNNKDTKTTSMMHFGVFIVNFEQINADWAEVDWVTKLPLILDVEFGDHP